jgi:signal transduction histidine kinase
VTPLHKRGRVEELVSQLYGRMGANVWWVSFGIGIFLGLLGMVITLLFGARYLRMSTDRAISLFALWGPLAVLMVFAGVFPRRAQLRTILAWSKAANKRQVAPEAWSATALNHRLVIRAAVFVSFVIPPAAIDIAVRFHKPWWGVFPFSVAFVIALASITALVVAIADMFLKPMLEEIASYLPQGFEPHTLRRRLQLKALIPLPLVTGFATIVVGAYANVSDDSVVRLSVALGVTFATVAVATAMFSILNRSLLSPIEDLIAATEKVRAGELNVSVPLVTDDELGSLALAFNQMIDDLRVRTEELRASRQRIVAAGNQARRQVERDLHDGAQQLLVLAQLKIGLAERAIETNPAQAKATIAELHEDMSRALSELRDLARGIYPPLLETDGLRSALEEAVNRAPIHAHLDCDGAGRYRPELEAAVYFCCVEALQNAAKHAGPDAHVEVRLGATSSSLLFEVEDNGHGFDLAGARNYAGLQNMEDRIGALGGELQVSSRPGQGTRIRGAVPV